MFGKYKIKTLFFIWILFFKNNSHAQSIEDIKLIDQLGIKSGKIILINPYIDTKNKLFLSEGQPDIYKSLEKMNFKYSIDKKIITLENKSKTAFPLCDIKYCYEFLKIYGRAQGYSGRIVQDLQNHFGVEKIEKGIPISALNESQMDDFSAYLGAEKFKDKTDFINRATKYLGLILDGQAKIRNHRFSDSEFYFFGYAIPMGPKGESWEAILSNSGLPSIGGINHFYTQDPTLALGVLSIPTEKISDEVKRTVISKMSEIQPHNTVNWEEITSYLSFKKISELYSKNNIILELPGFLEDYRIICLNLPKNAEVFDLDSILKAMCKFVGARYTVSEERRVVKMQPFNVFAGTYPVPYMNQLLYQIEKNHQISALSYPELLECRKIISATLEKNIKPKFIKNEIYDLSSISYIDKCALSWLLLSENIFNVYNSYNTYYNIIEYKNDILRIQKDAKGKTAVSIGRYLTEGQFVTRVVVSDGLKVN